jgi:hypothetical protein
MRQTLSPRPLQKPLSLDQAWRITVLIIDFGYDMKKVVAVQERLRFRRDGGDDDKTESYR